MEKIKKYLPVGIILFIVLSLFGYLGSTYVKEKKEHSVEISRLNTRLEVSQKVNIDLQKKNSELKTELEKLNESKEVEIDFSKDKDGAITKKTKIVYKKSHEKTSSDKKESEENLKKQEETKEDIKITKEDSKEVKKEEKEKRSSGLTAGTIGAFVGGAIVCLLTGACIFF